MSVSEVNKHQRIYESNAKCSQNTAHTITLLQLPDEIIKRILFFANSPCTYVVSKDFRRIQNEADRETITIIANVIFKTTYEDFTDGLPNKEEGPFHSVLYEVVRRREREVDREFEGGYRTFSRRFSKIEKASLQYFMRIEAWRRKHPKYCEAINEMFISLPIDQEKMISFNRFVSDLQSSEKGKKAREWMVDNQEELDKVKVVKSLYGLERILPDEVTRFPNLERLHLSRKKLTILPSKIGDFNKLTKLVVSGNYLVELPPSIGNLVELTELVAYDNLLVRLPRSIGRLKNLKGINLKNNRLSLLPDEFCNLENLQKLFLDWCPIVALPEDIGKLSKLAMLVIGNTLLTTLPSTFYNLTNLRELDVQNNKFSCFSSYIARMRNLRKLNISNNQIAEFSERIGENSELRELLMDNLFIRCIPKFVFGLKKLKVLSVENCGISQIPEEIGRMNQLKTLRMSRNNIQMMRLLPGMVFNQMELCIDWTATRRKRDKMIKVYLS